jgi:hypothetical protein
LRRAREGTPLKSDKSEKELKATIDLMGAGDTIKVQPVRPGGSADVIFFVKKGRDHPLSRR